MDSNTNIPQLRLDTSNVNRSLALVSGGIGIAISAAIYFLAEATAQKTIANVNDMLRDSFGSGEFKINQE